ncbi:hypothetical protein [Thiohalomonas denitrificans]|uniref:Uncharacterized protein n=1 Tax=Thiohalomonas denitrificans TaxID=415747 RepID=A0A1G5QVN0_9GAMM|nr:hypothetical protein [Thiohalomonas denitrificans]SCZ65726.1 hypothetical protein SAMN03097708_02873 [Thiohalomonas denitrificans]
MKRITEDLRRALAAMACSEAGEFLSPLQKASVLDSRKRSPAAVAVNRSHLRGRRLALATGGTGSPRAFDYALQCCRQLEAALDVISLNECIYEMDPSRSAELQAHGIQWRSLALDGEPLNALAGYLRNNVQPLFLVADETGFPATELLTGRVKKALWPSHIPLVVIAAGTPNP